MNFYHKIDFSMLMPKGSKDDPAYAKYISYCGVDCSKCFKRSECNGCVVSGGKPFGGECVIAECCKQNNTNGECGCSFCCRCRLKRRVLDEVRNCDIEELHVFNFIYEIPGTFINVDYTFPDGEVRKPFDVTKVYIWGQYKTPGRDRTYSIIADSENIWIADHEENGSDAYIMRHWKYSSEV